MSNVMRRLIAILGVIVGIVIIVIGINFINTYLWTYPVGEGIRFGADFYTEIYDVTSQVGNAVNDNTRGIQNLCEAIGWLIISIGAIDICSFLYLLFAPRQKTYKKVFCPKQDVATPVKAPEIEPTQPSTTEAV